MKLGPSEEEAGDHNPLGCLWMCQLSKLELGRYPKRGSLIEPEKSARVQLQKHQSQYCGAIVFGFNGLLLVRR